MINVHCDGACLDNGSPNASGGYGFIVEEDGKVISKKYGKLREGLQTNNRAELEAMVQALTWIKQSSWIDNESGTTNFCIYTDSKTIVDGILGTAKRRANRDIWTEVESLCKELNSRCKLSVVHVDKDSLTEDDKVYQFNVLADELAFIGANALIIVA